MKRVLIDDDNFVWHCLSESEACYYVDCGLPVHVISEQGCDRKIISKNEIRQAIRRRDYVATPVGYMDDK